jgi:hypothetical protein
VARNPICLGKITTGAPNREAEKCPNELGVGTRFWIFALLVACRRVASISVIMGSNVGGYRYSMQFHVDLYEDRSKRNLIQRWVELGNPFYVRIY